MRALLLAAAVAGWNYVAAPRVPERVRAPLHTALALALVRITGADPGLCPPAVWRGLRVGGAAAAVACAAVAVTTSSPRVRAGMAARETPVPAAQWVGYRIPFGTVVPEELVFRAALSTCAAKAFGVQGGRLVQAATFGLSHVADARAASEPILGTVLVTGAAGWVFGWLADHSGSVAAPMLAHLAVNEAGAIAALTVRRF